MVTLLKFYNINLVEDVVAVEVRGGLDEAGGHGLLSGAEGHAGIVVLLVGNVLALGVADLALEVIAVGGLVLTDSVPEGPLGVGVNVHLDDTVSNRLLDLVNGGAGSAVEDELHGLVLVAAKLLLDVSLGVVEDLGGKVDISGSVDTVDVAEGGSAGEGSVLDLRKLLVGVPDLLGLGVEAAGVDVGVVDAILLSSGDTELELEKDADLGEFLKVGLADADVLLEGLLGEVEHVGGEEGLSVGLEVLLRGGEEGVDPGKPRLLAVVGVKDDGDAVEGGDLTDVLGSGNGSGNGCRIVVVVKGLSGNELSATLGESDHDGSSVVLGGLHAGVDRVSTDDVDAGDGPLLLLRGVEEIDEGLTGNDTGLDGGREVGESLSSKTVALRGMN